ncbi:MAG: hypothetical protein HZB61_10800 [Nitrospirae bacterium]|nr:hypothetical protein [Nitrospirota bacterium]
MRKKVFLYVPFVFLLQSCSLTDTIDDVWLWFASLIETYLQPIICWFYTIFMGFIQMLVDFFLAMALGLVSVLPVYTVNIPSLSQYEFFQYAAYFLPIVEIATLMGYLISFYLTFWFGRIVLRWLKVIR